MNTDKPIHSIVATDINGVIGHGPKMPGWCVTDDYGLNFIPKTIGCPLIMGSITAESLGKPLKGRHCIVVTRSKEKAATFRAKGFITASSPWMAIMIAQKLSGETIWNIGGGEMYRWFQQNVIVKEVHITTIQNSYKGDNEVLFYGIAHNEYQINLSRSISFKKRAPGTNGPKDRGNSDYAVVEVYVRD